MKVNISQLANLKLTDLQELVIEIIVHYKNSQFPEDLERAIGVILKSKNLIEP